MTVVVIGAGLVGLATAYALREAGEAVTVLERRDGPGLECSFANGSLLHASLVEPWNSPGVLSTLLRTFGREDAAVLVRIATLPTLLGWGVRFIRESSPARFEYNTFRNIRLARYSLERMTAIRARTHVDYAAQRRGLLTVFRERAALEDSARWFERLAPLGIRSNALDSAAVLALEPALQPIAAAIVGGRHAPDDEGGDPHAFCVGLDRYLQDGGARIEYGRAVRRLQTEGRRVTGVELTSGECVAADHVVLAAGAWSARLASAVGVKLPIRPAKGYSLTLPRGESGTAPSMPIVDPALHMAVVPVGTDRLRVAGTAEFTGFDRSLKPARIANLGRLLEQAYPRYSAQLGAADRRPWTGFRPMCADGVPLIGPTRIPGLSVNTGHGHIGWTTAAGSGQLLADLLLGRPPQLVASEYAPTRFG